MMTLTELITARDDADAVYQRVFADYITKGRWGSPSVAGESFRATEAARNARRDAAAAVDAATKVS